MNNDNALKELKDFELELTKEYENLVNPIVILEKLNVLILQKAQIAIGGANESESYDQKIDSLVKGIQGIVTAAAEIKKTVNEATEKHESDKQLLRRLMTRFSDYQNIEKKNKIAETEIN